MIIAALMIGLSIPIVTISLFRTEPTGRGWFRRDSGHSGEDTTDLRELELAESAGSRIVGSFLGSAGERLGRFTPAKWRDSVDRRILLAGEDGRVSADRVFLIKVVAAAAGGTLGYLAYRQNPTPLMLGLSVTLTLLGYHLPDTILDRRGKKRQELIQRELPDILDQITMSVEAGMGFEGALARVVGANEGPLAEEFARALKEMQIGIPRAEALRNIVERTDVPDLRTFLIGIVQSEEYGLPIAQVLRVQAVEMRVKRRQRAEERALKMPVKLIFPLGLCIFPTLFIVLIGPAAIRLWRAFT